MIGDVIAAALPVLRRQAESLMTTPCDIDRLTTAWDEAQQKTTTTWAAVHAGIPCHVEEPVATSSVVLTGETTTLEAPVVKVPVAYLGTVLPDDRVTLAGREPLWVTRAAGDDGTHPVEYLLQCRWTR